VSRCPSPQTAMISVSHHIWARALHESARHPKLLSRALAAGARRRRGEAGCLPRARCAPAGWQGHSPGQRASAARQGAARPPPPTRPRRTGKTPTHKPTPIANQPAYTAPPASPRRPSPVWAHHSSLVPPPSGGAARGMLDIVPAPPRPVLPRPAPSTPLQERVHAAAPPAAGGASGGGPTTRRLLLQAPFVSGLAGARCWRALALGGCARPARAPGRGKMHAGRARALAHHLFAQVCV
jgi:hypothetical protein